MNKSILIRNIVIIVLAAVILGLPFINQAFHIDDTNFLYITKQILKDPLRPYSFNINWRGADERAFDILANPPLCPYYSALAIKLFGQSEPALHGAYLIFAVAAGLFMFFLSRRFTRHALICSLLMLVTPAFMVMSHTIMPDTALLVFYLAGITLFIYGVDKNRPGFLVLSGIFMGLASLCRYSGLTVFFIVIMYIAIQRKKFKAIILIPFFTGGLIFLAWCAHNTIFYGRMHFMAASGFQLVTLTAEDIFCKIEALLSYIGSTSVFFVFLIVGFFTARYKKIFFILAAPCFYLGVIAAMKYHASALQIIFISIFMLSSLHFFFIAIDSIIAQKAKNIKKDYLFLIGWVFFIIIFTGTIYFSAVKHILLLLPAFLILFVVLIERFCARFVKIYLAVALIATFLCGISVSYADFMYADVYRDFAYKNALKYKNSSNTVWFAGHWGFQYYMESLGCKALTYDDNSPKKGDVLIMPVLIAEHQWPCELLQKRLSLLDVYGYGLIFPIRTMNARKNFSFYTNIMLGYNPGFLAYYFSSQNLEQFVVYKIM
ncbi:MAG: hypothetical protein COW11_03620 [Candidatus Omnitrophica bacterium CG12_big_fil_rev_8_21_14_0_65_43_15]|uniref:Glycosyltransferase RgtA/B/C/D-like domain-containing protein n=1 Tax=Candidatus Taenaricola geysiri TaxID=1974752 RepID=A0A2J0LL86_9BACT|nr:MAG: hypothetical protein COS48_02050 [Candidatus Omnitrophica bacterium CG03_land_8_20_14_0_80_43_22]PIW66383.1 MAG: hypothetical protein COW11_03620 [Candidatus Omnitrophica bacterium CG12_big_fil_rev_8_21_14_0_65_43_15]PIY83448.1 MAG: hypothetical protein COY77_05350 [Candidatus Omnitrophica bacterium CG_4_10_14_0_8_um_filter_43_18]